MCWVPFTRDVHERIAEHVQYVSLLPKSIWINANTKRQKMYRGKTGEITNSLLREIAGEYCSSDHQ